MRLDKVKIAGFKSFVDPITIDLRSNLTGVVGPNGCGKSNTIDAVRWVMGESSAKHLRGSSMDDVIFSGSSSRKPIGKASVELLFDNSDGSLGGEYAKYAEIGIKREISRDGQSKYFLNGTRCRRRDITDIFLGTGLGPRSYAIIEQGMISRLIEAKPEELRTTLEEAAGVSKYKERRRETERRIKNTRENLERLTDIREELEKNINHLNRQAKAAERFKTLKHDERKTSAELILLRLKKVHDDVEIRQNVINENATKHQAKLAEQRSLENKIESQRSAHTQANEDFNKVQASFYQAGSEISRLEQTIQHQKELLERQKRELIQVDEELAAANIHAEEDQKQLETANKELETLEPTLEKQRAELDKSSETLHVAEAELSTWQQAWNSMQQRLAEPAQQAQVERTRMEQFENQLQHIASRLLKLQTDQGVFNTDAYETELKQQQEKLTEYKEKSQQAQEKLESSKQAVDSLSDSNQNTRQALEETRSQLQSLTGRLASLEVLQQAGLNKDDGKQSVKARDAWLSDHQLNNAPRLAESINVEPGWEKAVETVLGDLLESLQLDSTADLEKLMQDAPSVSVSASFITASSTSQKPPTNSLATKVSEPKSLHALLSHIYCADSVDDAIKQKAKLNNGELLITRDGVLIGENWLKMQAQDKGSAQDGVLARQKQIESTQSEIKELKAALIKHEEILEAGKEESTQLKEQQTQLQNSVNQLHREESQAQSVISATENRIQQTQSNQKRVLLEITDLEIRQTREQEAHVKATHLRNTAMELLETLEKEKTELTGKDAPLQQTVSEMRQKTQQLRDHAQQTQVQVETFKTTRNSAQQQLERFKGRLEQLHARKSNLKEQSAEQSTEDPSTLTEQLEKQLEQRKQIEVELNSARDALQTIDNTVRELEQKRHQAEQEVETFRTLIEKLKLEWQEVSVREETLQEQFSETEFDAKELNEALDEAIKDGSINLQSHQRELEEIQQKVARLGAINLAAIDEYKVQSERKVFLDEQDADLVEALETLETAIAKIDRDTRSLFKDTFEKVNVRIQEMFPQLFGGGHAHLEMTGDDLLTTGISIMAQPPGKRISSIHLMSGGEKALTAVAMVFAIFELNPAPFCMLDEVDAPLDEANIGRFCALVKKMSERVQFIFITHSKTTMELADNLIGVTMREPGVSRLVSVDVNEAARMAQE
ncbi:MAG: chromosome segregation protein SMC [Cocleimonas sp.]|nr:chromosome segregation protein SMC [Cocleimonas sp.]